MKLRIACAILLTIICGDVFGQAVEKDTAIVNQYHYISVFYNCEPLHNYKVLGTGKGLGGISVEDLIIFGLGGAAISAPKNLGELFEIYADAAKGHYQNCTGITFKDMHFGRDVFGAIQTVHADSREDTAIFSTPIFLCAKPIRAYDTLGVIRGTTGFKSLNSSLMRYFQKAKKKYLGCDGIIIDNIDLLVGALKITAFKWEKP